MLHIDQLLTFSRPRRELGVAGWCCDEDLTLPDEMWIESELTRTPCLTGIARPDVARAYNRPALDRAGFVCRYPASAGDAPARLVARRGDHQFVIGRVSARRSSQLSQPESAADAYTTWLREHESRQWQPSQIDGILRSLTRAPRISVILPTYNTALYYLDRCIRSVTSQLYPYWELCIADDASPTAGVRQFLRDRAANDRRIRLSFAERNGGISAASNLAIATASGEFSTLLDHDDELHPSALLEVARCIDAWPDTDVAYSDEDKIDQLGIRSQPAFKPDFDEDLLRGVDYLGHLVAMRTTLVKQVGGFRSVADGAQDWDLLMRVTSGTTPQRIRHIPEPLYHWRMHEESTALSLDAKPFAVRAWNVALQHQLQEDTSSRIADGLFFGSMRIVRSVPSDTRVSIISRACDGAYQRRALRAMRIPCRVGFFELVFSNVYRTDSNDSLPLLTVEDLESDVTVVVSYGIDSVNHYFLEELTSQALREECGIVGGTILNVRGAVLTAGLGCLSNGTYVNLFEGLAPQDPGYMGLARVVRAVPAIGPHVFAFRTERLLELTGLASLNEDSLSEVCDALVDTAHARGLKVLHTPWAIATLRRATPAYQHRSRHLPRRELMFSRNLETYLTAAGILKAGQP